MRPALFLHSAVILALGGVVGCSHNGACGAAPLDDTTHLPPAPAATTSGSTPRPITVRFAGVASSGAIAQVFLLSTAPAVDAMGVVLHGADGHELLDPNVDATLHTPATTVAAVRDYVSSTTPVNAWLDEHSHWPGMRGLGIGRTPVLPQWPAGGPFVAIGSTTSIVRFPLGALEPDDNDAGPAPDTGFDSGIGDTPSPQDAREWEWPWPVMTGAVDAGADVTGPLLSDLLVVPRYAPDHDLALVARTTSVVGGVASGGETWVLDIDDPSRVTSLAQVSFDTYADSGLRANAAAFAFASEHLVFVALDHQNFASSPTYGPGLVAVVDPGMRSVRTVLRIPSMTNCTRIARYNPPTRVLAPDPHADPTDDGEQYRMVVTCLGTAPTSAGATPSDAGFVYLEWDPSMADRVPSIARTIPASALGIPRPDGGIMPLYGHLVAFVTQGNVMPASPDRLIVVNVDTGDTQTLRTATTSGLTSAGLGPGGFDPESGVLVVPNGLDGVLTWQVPRAFHTLEGASTGTYRFPDAVEVVVSASGCGHVAMRLVRALGGVAAVVAPMIDAGMQDGGMPATDAGVGDAGGDAGMDAGLAPADAGHDAGQDANVDAP